MSHSSEDKAKKKIQHKPDVSQAKGHEMCLLTIVCKASVTCRGMLLSSA